MNGIDRGESGIPNDELCAITALLLCFLSNQENTYPELTDVRGPDVHELDCPVLMSIHFIVRLRQILRWNREIPSYRFAGKQSRSSR